jgi:glycosyltransferase involved in cell wall biosynthesis
MNEVLISFIVPTRGRPRKMLSFLEGVRDHATSPQNIEIVMVVDDDDLASQAITFEGLGVLKVVVPHGLTMGGLIMAGYRASRGKYIMLMNDDVHVKTHGWDDKVLAASRSFEDEIVLVHVNDMTFGEALCIFPFVSRRYCEMAGGICSEQYSRYRIDDHIYDVFGLLTLLGHKRVVYLHDVVFEHLNVVIDSHGEAEYVPDPQVHAKDTVLFDDMRHAREELAVRLAARIDTFRRRESDKGKRNLLAPQASSVSSRRFAEHDRMAMLTRARISWLVILVEREIGKLFCTLGFVRVGGVLWNRARGRETLRLCLKRL